MLVIIGSVVVALCVFGGYMAMGGKLGVLWQPFEAVIIIGAAIGALIIGSPMSVIKQFGGAMGMAFTFKGSPYKKDDFIELFSMQFQVFKLAKAKGMLALEPHVENAEDSDLFGQFPNFHANHHALTLMCDYLRMISLAPKNHTRWKR